MCQGLICRRCALTNSRRTRAFYYVLKQPCLHLAQAPPERALVTTASQPFLSFLQGPRLVEFATRNTKRWKRGKERERASETRFERFALCTKRSEFPCWVDAQRSGSTFLSLSCQHWKASPPSPRGGVPGKSRKSGHGQPPKSIPPACRAWPGRNVVVGDGDTSINVLYKVSE